MIKEVFDRKSFMKTENITSNNITIENDLKYLEQKAIEFWNYVEKKKPPVILSEI